MCIDVCAAEDSRVVTNPRSGELICIFRNIKGFMVVAVPAFFMLLLSRLLRLRVRAWLDLAILLPLMPSDLSFFLFFSQWF